MTADPSSELQLECCPRWSAGMARRDGTWQCPTCRFKLARCDDRTGDFRSP